MQTGQMRLKPALWTSRVQASEWAAQLPVERWWWALVQQPHQHHPSTILAAVRALHPKCYQQLARAPHHHHQNHHHHQDQQRQLK
jgi:hypothetical protein